MSCRFRRVSETDMNVDPVEARLCERLLFDGKETEAEPFLYIEAAITPIRLQRWSSSSEKEEAVERGPLDLMARSRMSTCEALGQDSLARNQMK